MVRSHATQKVSYSYTNPRAAPSTLCSDSDGLPVSPQEWVRLFGGKMVIQVVRTE